MSTTWLRAFRHAALDSRPRSARVRPPRRLTRSFHASLPRRDDDDGNNKAENDGKKVGGAAGNASEENTTETLGRKRPQTAWRARAARNRKSELPPVQIPKHFLDLSVSRYDTPGSATPLAADSAIGELSTRSELLSGRSPMDKRFNDNVLTAALWNAPLVEDAMETIESADDLESIVRRTDLILAATSAIMASSPYVTGVDQKEVIKDVIDNLDVSGMRKVASPQSDEVSALHSYAMWVGTPDFISEIFVKPVVDGREPRLHPAAFFDARIVDEVAAAINADLFIRAPKDVRLAALRRPVTIINLPQCAGFSVAQDILRDVSSRLGADVLHLRAVDIADIVGRYIGQDVTRAPGDMSLLGYRTAENGGKVRATPVAEDDGDDSTAFEVPLSITLRQEKPRKDTRRQTISMEDFLVNSNTRGKSDEMWEDMKVNAALDELVHAADVEGAERRPLVVHIDNYNALDMDTESGAAVIARIRKVVDELWSTGRRIALIGSCASYSPHGTPKAYQTKLRSLEKSERVIHMYARRLPGDSRASMRKILQFWDTQDTVRENDENIVRMLRSMTEGQGSEQEPLEGALSEDDQHGIRKDDGRRLILVDKDGKKNQAQNLVMADMDRSEYYRSVLSFGEIYRIAVTMIGLNTGSKLDLPELFSKKRLREAMGLLKLADKRREKQDDYDKRIERNDSAKAPPRSSSQRLDPRAENHEQKLLSGLVNAKDIRTTFNDIHAPKETIDSIKTLTTLSLVRPEAFSYGVLATDRIPGCLLYGPPGTGKTLLAKAVAKESGANMLEISGASIVNMYIGESEKNVRAVFRLAKKHQPMIVFIDEADALLGARNGRDHAGRREITNQFLREWDGMDNTNAFIMVATNRPFDLDDAVLRRLPRKLLIDLPLEADRAAILRIHLAGESLDETVSIDEIAKNTPLYSGSDLKNVCVAAAMAAVKEELEASERHEGPGPYEWAKVRLLSRRHFDRALQEISASVSEDMSTLTAIRKFDERYGDSTLANKKKRRKGMGFGVLPDAVDSNEARVRHQGP